MNTTILADMVNMQRSVNFVALCWKILRFPSPHSLDPFLKRPDLVPVLRWHNLVDRALTTMESYQSRQQSQRVAQAPTHCPTGTFRSAERDSRARPCDMHTVTTLAQYNPAMVSNDLPPINLL